MWGCKLRNGINWQGALKQIGGGRKTKDGYTEDMEGRSQCENPVSSHLDVAQSIQYCESDETLRGPTEI
jgi:hypothetical protein